MILPIILALFCQTPQQLVDAAAPGSTVLLPAGNFFPDELRIDKPLTVLGSPLGTTVEGIRLAGNGGTLTLAHINSGRAMLTDGPGFDRLILSELSGFGVLVLGNARYVAISRSSFGVSTNDPITDPADLTAPLATVLLLDCQMQDGSIDCDRLFLSNSTDGGVWNVRASVPLQNDLTLDGPLRPGGSFVLSWTLPPTGFTVLYAATGTRSNPTGSRSFGAPWHLDGSAWIFLVAPSPLSVGFGLPPSSDLLGVELAMQAFNPVARKLSRPVMEVVRP